MVMMQKFKKLNNISGWAIFAIATIVYWLTVVNIANALHEKGMEIETGSGSTMLDLVAATQKNTFLEIAVIITNELIKEEEK